MTIVDTSVWIDFMRKRDPLPLTRFVELDEIVVCLPVVQEVLQGIADERSFRRAHDSLFAFPMVEAPLSQNCFEEAIELYRRARKAGLTVRSSVDCLIAACAIRHDLEVLHRDRDFRALARVSALRERSV